MVINDSTVLDIVMPLSLERIGLLINLIQAIGVVIIIYLIYAAISGYLQYKNRKRMVNIEKKVVSIEKKLDKLLKK